MGAAEMMSQKLSTTPRPVPDKKSTDPTFSMRIYHGYMIGGVNMGHVLAFGVLSGGMWLAPFMHWFYRLSAAWSIRNRIVVNSLVIDPINYAVAMISGAFCHGEGLVCGLETVNAKLGDTILTGFLVWPAAQVISFNYVPLHWRVLMFNSVSLCWNSYLAWSVRRHVTGEAACAADEVGEAPSDLT